MVEMIGNGLVEKVIGLINRDLTPGHAPQPMFIVGISGAGKTTLINKIAVELKHKVEGDQLKLLDGRSFFCSQDIIQAIEGRDYNMTIQEYSHKNKPSQIVLIDDFDYFFKRSSFDDQYILRNYLNRESAPLLIGTISNIGEAIADYRAPFFEGVRMVYIPTLDMNAIASMSFPQEKKERIMALMKLLPPTVRSLKIACEIIESGYQDQEDTKYLVRRLAPSLRETFDRLPIYSQKIIYSMAGYEKPLTLSELREITGLSAGTLSTYLSQLIKTGHIRKVGFKKRGIPYEISNPLFKLWLSANRLQPTSSPTSPIERTPE